MKEKLRKLHIAYLRNRAVCKQELALPRRALIVAPHPDDEVIGCGGLIARLVDDGRAPHVVVMTGGEGSHRGCCDTPSEDIVKARRGLTRKALFILGVPEENIHELNFPDGKISLAESAEVVQLKAVIANIAPSLAGRDGEGFSVFVPHWGEGWPDHVNAAKIIKNIMPSTTEVWEYCVWMWYYNVWRGLDWRNAAVLRMTPWEHELKLKAMVAYTKPLAPCGKPWSGVLPPLFLKTNQWNNELYFKVR